MRQETIELRMFRSENGFALLEAILAVVLLMVMLIPVARLVSDSSKLSGYQRAKAVAYQIANSYLSEAEAGQWQSLPSKSTETEGGVTYTVTVTEGSCVYDQNKQGLTSVGNSSSSPVLYVVDVQVSWSGHAVSMDAEVPTLPANEASNSCPL